MSRHEYGNPGVTHLRHACEKVLGRKIPATEDFDKTAEDLERYAAARDAKAPASEDGGSGDGITSK